MSVRLYVGNLPKDVVERDELHTMFAATAGEGFTTKVIKDRKTGKCRGFAFVTVPTDEVADALIEQFDGQAFMDTTLKIEKALPREKGKEEGEEAPSASTGGSTGGSTGSKKQKNPRSKQRTAQGGPAVTSSGPDLSAQPDPRWASELSKLKALLATQTAP